MQVCGLVCPLLCRYGIDEMTSYQRYIWLDDFLRAKSFCCSGISTDIHESRKEWESSWRVMKSTISLSIMTLFEDCFMTGDLNK